MLRRNLEAAIGLVNGACGVLNKIGMDANDKPFALYVKFDHIDKEQKILQVENPFFRFTY